MRKLVKIILLLMGICFILAIALYFVFDVAHANSSNKRVLSNLAREEILLALRSQDDCLISFQESCGEKFKTKFRYLAKKSNNEFVYHDKSHKYIMRFIKESDDWKCYAPKNGYHVVGCKELE